MSHDADTGPVIFAVDAALMLTHKMARIRSTRKVYTSASTLAHRLQSPHVDQCRIITLMTKASSHRLATTLRCTSYFTAPILQLRTILCHLSPNKIHPQSMWMVGYLPIMLWTLWMRIRPTHRDHPTMTTVIHPMVDSQCLCMNPLCLNSWMMETMTTMAAFTSLVTRFHDSPGTTNLSSVTHPPIGGVLLLTFALLFIGI